MRRTGLLGKIRNIFSEESREKRRQWLKSKTEMPRWKIRRKAWNMWTWLKFKSKKPMKISLPNRRKDNLELVVITKMFKGLDDLTKDTPYRVPNRYPSDEKPFPGYWVKKLVFGLQAWLCRTKRLSPMQNGLPPIHEDPQLALDNAYSERGENLWPRPKLPPVFYDSPDLTSLDLGILAVEGPYAGYLEKVKNQEGVYQWNLLKLGDYQTHPGLYRLGVRVEFKVGEWIPWGSDSKPFFPLRAVKIELKDPSLFGVGDLKDPTRLAIRLRDTTDPVSKFLQERFSDNTKRLLREYNGATPPSESLQAALVQELNQPFNKNRPLYDKKRFGQVTLRKETQMLIDQNPKEGDLIHLNRFLLEDAYPQEIAKSQIKDPELTSSVKPGDKHWGLAKKIALCALTNHTSIIRHWSWIHLIPATQLAFATRTILNPDHPLRRLLWPHIYGTVQATRVGTMAQMAKGGDFENVFSFPHAEMCTLFNDSYRDFRLCRSVPELDLQARGIGIKKGKVEFSMPTHENLKELFNVLQTHVKNYLEIYYHNELFGAGDFKDPTSLAVKLRNAADLVSKFLQDQFSNTTQQLLREYIDATPPSESLQAALIQELNQILKGVSLYDKDRFTQVTLRKETQPLIEQNPKEGDLIRLNRFLLEDAYPQEIAKRQNFIHNNKELVTWLKTLHTGLPGGILEVLKNEVLDETIRTKKEPPKEADIQLKNVTLDNVARLIASFKFLGSVQHEMMGSLLWNYQLWTHRQPTRVYKNGGREPLDVYQRLVNYNFMLMVDREKIMNEKIYRRMTKGLPKEKKGKLEKWHGQFVAELEELQSTMDAESWEPWRIYPKDLEAHINA